jgi:hypothetical protein
VFDLKKDGPMVFEVPPGVMGPLDDHNFLFVADIGPTGQDRGEGGKYLLLPPDYEGDCCLLVRRFSTFSDNGTVSNTKSDYTSALTVVATGRTHNKD